MSNFQLRQSSNYLRMFTVMSICCWTMSVFAQSVTWQILPWPANLTWGGPEGSPAVTNGNQITLTGQDVLTVQDFTAPLMMSYDVLLPSKSTTDGGFKLYFVPTGEATNLLPNPDIYLQMGESQSGTEDALEVLDGENGVAVWGPLPYPIQTQTVYHVSVSVATNGVVSWAINGVDVGLSNSIVVPYTNFQLRLGSWQPTQVWQISNFTTGLPSGYFTYSFTNTPLWDLSGIYTNSTVTNDVVIATMDCQANGQITGSRVEHYVNGADNATGTGTISGKAFVKAGQLQAKLVSVGELSGVQGGVDYLAKFMSRGTALLDAPSLTIFTEGTIRVCVVGGKCATDTQGYSIGLPEGMNGDWTLDTDIAANGDKLTGTGTLTLSNNRVLTYQITGSFNTKSEIAKLKLVGEGDAIGTSLSLTTQGTGMNLTGLKGKVLGQTPSFP